MSRTEDYLDELLHSVSNTDEGGKRRSGKKKMQQEDEDFLSAFEEEILSSDDSDNFIRQFEEELDLGGKGFRGSAAAGENMEFMQSGLKESAQSQSVSEENAFGSQDLDSLLSNAKEKMDGAGKESFEEQQESWPFGESAESPQADEPQIKDWPAEEPEALQSESSAEWKANELDTDADLFPSEETAADWPTDDASGESNQQEAPQDDLFGGMDIMVDTLDDMSEQNGQESGAVSELEQRLGSLAGAAGDLGDFSELGEEFARDQFDEEMMPEEESVMPESEPAEEEQDLKKKKRFRKRKKKEKKKENMSESDSIENGKEKTGFFQKLSKTMFGEDEKEEENAQSEKLSKEAKAAEKEKKKKEYGSF